MKSGGRLQFNISLLEIFLMLDDMSVQQLPSTSEFSIYVFEERKI